MDEGSRNIEKLFGLVIRRVLVVYVKSGGLVGIELDYRVWNEIEKRGKC